LTFEEKIAYRKTNLPSLGTSMIALPSFLAMQKVARSLQEPLPVCAASVQGSPSCAMYKLMAETAR